MKIKGFFVIPLIAILIAMFTLGAVDGTAVDTSADQSTSEISDTLTFVPPTTPATSSLEEEVVGFVSNNLGGALEDASGPVKGFTQQIQNLLNQLLTYLNMFLNLFRAGGDLLGNGNILGNLGGGLAG